MIAKLLEKSVLMRLEKHTERSNILPKYQFGFRSGVRALPK